MIYATPADMVERFGEPEMIQFTDLEGAGMVNAAKLTRVLDDATAFADGYLGRVYQLPLRGCIKPATTVGSTPEFAVPPSLKRVICDLARYYLYTDVIEEHEAVRRYKAAVKELEAIANGSIQLSCPWGGSAGTSLHADALEAQAVYHSFGPRQINDDSLRGFA